MKTPVARDYYQLTEDTFNLYCRVEVKGSKSKKIKKSIFALAVFEYENNLLVVTEFLCGHWKVPILIFLKGSK